MLEQKYEQLRERLCELGSIAVAFSAGVDSTLLLAVAHDVLGKRAVAFTAVSPANPQREIDEAALFCQERGIKQVTFNVNELENEGFEHNPTNRCYLCKAALFSEILERAFSMGLAAVVEGSNVDDLGDYRPGRRALEELGIHSPLLECGFTKQAIRELSQQLKLPTWEKPSFACLYTRFAYDELITPEKLARVDKAEQFLLNQGFKTVRVRMIGDVARIEVAADEIESLAAPPLREQCVENLKELGFACVTLDLQGYRTGSMNELL